MFDDLLSNINIRYTNEAEPRVAILDCISLLCDCDATKAKQLLFQYNQSDFDTHYVHKYKEKPAGETYVADIDTLKNILSNIPSELYKFNPDVELGGDQNSSYYANDTGIEQCIEKVDYQNYYIKSMISNIKDAAKTIMSISGKEASDKVHSQQLIGSLQQVVLNVIQNEYLPKLENLPPLMPAQPVQPAQPVHPAASRKRARLHEDNLQ